VESRRTPTIQYAALLNVGNSSSLKLKQPGIYILNHMRGRRASRTLLFIFLAFWTTAGADAFSLGLAGAGTMTVSAGQGFGPKLQYGGRLSLDFVFPILPWLALDASIDAFTVAPSDISGGFLYRGYSGGAVALMSQFSGTIASSSSLGAIRGGGGLGIAGALPSYWYTTLAFFYVEPRVQGFLDWQPAGLPAWHFQLFLPVSMQLRRDLDYSLTAGLGIRVFYAFGANR
jgi:hypothetical protein